MHLPRLLTATALFSLLLLPVTSYGQPGEEEALAQARKHISDRRYYFATTWLERLLRDHPSTSHRKDALLLIIKAYSLSGREEKAVPYVKALTREFPTAVAALDPELVELAKASKDEGPVPIPPPPPAAEKENASGGTAAAAPTIPGPAKSTPEPPVTAPPAHGTGTSQAGPAATENSMPPAKDAGTTGGQASSPQKREFPREVSSPTPADGTVSYYAVIDGTTSRKKLDALLKKVKAAGMKPIVREETRNTEVFRLVSECYGNRKAAEQARLSALKAKAAPFIIRDGNAYCLVVGSVRSEPAAQQEQKRLARKGVEARVVRSQVSLGHFQLFLGRFSSEQDARNAVKALAARGIAATIQKTAD